jgi:hypothetical protein
LNPHGQKAARFSKPARQTVSGYPPYRVDPAGVEPALPARQAGVVSLDHRPVMISPRSVNDRRKALWQFSPRQGSGGRRTVAVTVVGEPDRVRLHPEHEMGVLVTGGDLPVRVEQHFDGLIWLGFSNLSLDERGFSLVALRTQRAVPILPGVIRSACLAMPLTRSGTGDRRERRWPVCQEPPPRQGLMDLKPHRNPASEAGCPRRSGADVKS